MSFTFSKIKVPMLIVNTCFQYPTSALHTPTKEKASDLDSLTPP